MLNVKLVALQSSVDKFIKDGYNAESKYKFVSSDEVLNRLRPQMCELSLLLEMHVKEVKVGEGQTRSGTTRFFTELWIDFVWIDAEDGESKTIPFYAQGTDLAGEKGVGKALTYAEKYFFMKQFHIPTSDADPDNDKRTQRGELKQRGTQAAAETDAYMRSAITTMLNEICSNDADKFSQALEAWTKDASRGFEGYRALELMADQAVPATYAKCKSAYEKRTGKAWKK